MSLFLNNLKNEFKAKGLVLKKSHSIQIINMEEEVVPKGPESIPYWDAFWNGLPKKARFDRAYSWDSDHLKTEEEILESII